MYEFFEGKIENANPAFLVLNVNGVGFHLQISINTYEKIKELKNVRILAHQAIKEDGHYLYGFFDEIERQLFRNLISVNGVGTNTARMILSGQRPTEIISAISTGNINALKSVKGVGPKTAQRIILELQDKITRMATPAEMMMTQSQDNKSIEEAILALQALGFQRVAAEKALVKITNNYKISMSVEELIIQGLKHL